MDAPRTFFNGENLISFFEIYPGPETESVALRMSVRRSGAQTGIELPVYRIATEGDAAKIPVSRYIELEGLPPGTYLLAVLAGDERAGEVAQTQTSFSVVSRTGN
jgi:hypothetical protein